MNLSGACKTERACRRAKCLKLTKVHINFFDAIYQICSFVLIITFDYDWFNMNTPNIRQQKIQTIRQFPADLRAAVAGLTVDQLTATPIDGEWSIVQNVHHCADSHINSYVRLKLILTEDNPPIKPYAEPLWAQFRDANNIDMSHTFALLDGLHARWVDTYETLADEQWQRAGVHGDLGKITVDDLLDIYDNHCRAHLAQIERTKAALGIA